MSVNSNREHWVRSEVEVIRQIAAPALPIWQTISAVGGVQHWVPMVEDCCLEGRGVGAYRLCKTKAGTIRELIQRIDHLERIFEYIIEEQAIFPFQNFIGKIQVRKLEEALTEMYWKGVYDIPHYQELPVKSNIEKMFEEAIDGLYQFSKV